MDPLIEKQETEYIIKDLLSSRSHDDIIRDVCYRTKCTWLEAQYLLERTLRENKKQIQREKNPLRLLVSILAIAVGLVWLGSICLEALPPMLSFAHLNGTLAGYQFPQGSFEMLFELVVAVGMIILAIALIVQQLRTTRR
jgi:hypothetical protein